MLRQRVRRDKLGRMSKRVDITGQRFNRLLVLRLARSVNGELMWECLCDCGKTKVVRGKDMKRGFTTSCGCRNGEVTAARNRSNAGKRIRPRKQPHPLLGTWTAMIHRCKNPNVGSFAHYGARGIRVCSRWQTIENFAADMGPKPTPAHTIERIDVNGDYEPGNCRWATRREQNRNKRNSCWIEHNGVRLTMAEWCERTGIHQATLSTRLRHGWSAAQALTLGKGRL